MGHNISMLQNICESCCSQIVSHGACIRFHRSCCTGSVGVRGSAASYMFSAARGTHCEAGGCGEGWQPRTPRPYTPPPFLRRNYILHLWNHWHAERYICTLLQSIVNCVPCHACDRIHQYSASSMKCKGVLSGLTASYSRWCACTSCGTILPDSRAVALAQGLKSHCN